MASRRNRPTQGHVALAGWFEYEANNQMPQEQGMNIPSMIGELGRNQPTKGIGLGEEPQLSMALRLALGLPVVLDWSKATITQPKGFSAHHLKNKITRWTEVKV